MGFSNVETINQFQLTNISISYKLLKMLGFIRQLLDF